MALVCVTLLSLTPFSDVAAQEPSDCNPDTDYVAAGNTHNDYQAYTLALEAFNCALILDPESEMAYLGRGLAYVALGEHELAEEDYTAAIALNDESYGYVRRASVRINLGDYRTAVRDLRYAIQFYAQDPNIYAFLAMAYMNLGEFDLAMENLEATTDLELNDPSIYLNLGIVYQGLGECEQAIHLYTQAIEFTQTGPIALKNFVLARAYVHRGICQSVKGNNESALEDHNMAIEISPSWAQAYNSRGGLYADMGHYEEALSDFDKAIEISPTYWLAFMNKAVVHYLQRDYRVAIHDLESAIGIAPDQGLLYLYLGEVYVVMGDLARAAENFQIYESLVDPSEITPEIRARIDQVTEAAS